MHIEVSYSCTVRNQRVSINLDKHQSILARIDCRKHKKNRGSSPFIMYRISRIAIRRRDKNKDQGQ